jgi:hypothetical protein
MANLINFLLLIVFFWGRSLRFKNLDQHARLMVIAMTGDFLLVLGLVIFRRALGEISPVMHWTLMIHVPVAVSTLLLYVITARFGFALRRGEESARAPHKLSAKILVVLRVSTLVTALMVQYLR